MDFYFIFLIFLGILENIKLNIWYIFIKKKNSYIYKTRILNLKNKVLQELKNKIVEKRTNNIFKGLEKLNKFNGENKNIIIKFMISSEFIRKIK